MFNANNFQTLVESVKSNPLTSRVPFDSEGSKAWQLDLCLSRKQAADVDALATRKHDQGRTVKLGFDNEMALVAVRGTHNGTRLAYRFQYVEFSYA